MPDSPARKQKKTGLIVTTFLMMFMYHACIYNITSVYIIPVTEEFGVSRVAFTTHVTFLTLATIIGSFMLGPLLRTLSRRTFFVGTAVIVTASEYLYSLTTAVWEFYVLSSIMGIGVVILGSTGVSVLVNEGISSENKGKIMGVIMTGSGFGGVVLAMLVSRVIAVWDWRMSFRINALLMLLLIPLMIIFIRDPEPAAGKKQGSAGEEGVMESSRNAAQSAAGGTSVDEDPLAVMERLKAYRKTFWFVAAVMITFGYSCMVLIASISPYGRELGFSQTTADMCVSLECGALVVGKLLLGAFIDRFGSKTGMVVFTATQAFAQVLVALAIHLPLLYFPAIILFGIADSVGTVGLPMFFNDIFGPERYNDVVGKVLALAGLGDAAAPVVASLLYDSTGSYVPSLWSSAVVGVLFSAGCWYAYRLSLVKKPE